MIDVLEYCRASCLAGSKEKEVEVLSAGRVTGHQFFNGLRSRVPCRTGLEEDRPQVPDAAAEYPGRYGVAGFAGLSQEVESVYTAPGTQSGTVGPEAESTAG